MENSPKYLPIKSWSVDDRPREKLMNNGSKALSNSELMAILIGTGSRGESAISVCKKILNDHENNLHKIGRLSVKDFMKYKGIGEAKAISLVAALELGFRRQFAQEEEKIVIQSSQDAYRFIAPKLSHLPFEEFHIILLNQANRVIQSIKISSGGVSATVVDARAVLKQAIELLASSVILVHNHPSGSLKPSNNDIQLTKKLSEGAQLFNINVLDHLIISDEGYYSFADEGIM
ncbi:MAG TPA: DNA repair protein RadC [Saprospiraceae bacterium]|nr:DNA repair protein RadC [Saprospiraceae bacterium]